MNLGYTGKPYDSATGLYNYGYRDYKPEAARFTTVDPIRDGANWFAYVNNDPVNWVDPDGLLPDAIWDIASIITGAGSLVGNIRSGNVGGAIIDAVGIVVDTAAFLTPGLPGGVGMAVKAVRAAHSTAETVENVMTITSGVVEGNTRKIIEGSVGIVSTGLSVASGQNISKAAEYAPSFLTKYEQIANISAGAATLMDAGKAVNVNISGSKYNVKNK
jgi:RHS repeat-associated protein